MARMKRRATSTRRRKNALGKVVKRLIQTEAEKKWYTYTPFSSQAGAVTWTMCSAISGANSAGATGSSTIGAGIIVGNTVNQRTGDKIRLSKIEFQIYIQPLYGGTSLNGDSCRWIIWHYKQANGTLISPLTIFDTNAVTTLRNIDQLATCSIIKQGVHQMVLTGNNAGTPVSAGPALGPITVTIYPKKRIDFNAGGANAATLVKDDYGFGFASSGANCCVVSLLTKVFYTDD